MEKGTERPRAEKGRGIHGARRSGDTRAAGRRGVPSATRRELGDLGIQKGRTDIPSATRKRTGRSGDTGGAFYKERIGDPAIEEEHGIHPVLRGKIWEI